MKIVTNGKVYALWDEMLGWRMTYHVSQYVTSEHPLYLTTLSEAKAQLEAWKEEQKDNTWTEVE